MSMLGARAYLRLGNRDAEAAEVAHLALAETKKYTAMIESHRVLGVVAARRGDLAGAEASFVRASDVARSVGHYLLELLAARDLVQYVYEAQGRTGEGEAMAEEAAGRMGKCRADFEELWVLRRPW